MKLEKSTIKKLIWLTGFMITIIIYFEVIR